MNNISNRQGNLLQQEVAYLQNWLDSFSASSTGKPRTAILGATGEYMVLERMPLPDKYAPDEIDAMLLLDNFPSVAPIGLYVLNHGNERLVAQLRDRMNAFKDIAFHGAQSIPGYTWLCYVYQDNKWNYNAAAPMKGDCVRKFVGSFYSVLES